MIADALPSREVVEQEVLWRKASSFRSDPLGFEEALENEITNLG